MYTSVKQLILSLLLGMSLLLIMLPALAREMPTEAFDTGETEAVPLHHSLETTQASHTETNEMTPTIAITKWGSPNPVLAGKQATYTLHVTNATSQTRMAFVTDTLPAVVTPTGILTWTPLIEPHSSWTEQVVVTVFESITDRFITNVAAATFNVAQNESYCTTCAEEDNVNVPLFSPGSKQFQIIATHPAYTVTADNCDPDFSGCDLPTALMPIAGSCDTPFYDDHQTNVIRVCVEPEWWLTNTMTVTVGSMVTTGHRLVWHKKIMDESSWPEVLVIYEDGNVRLKPHPKKGQADNCFGSSVIVGPATPAMRPYAEIEAITVHTETMTLDLAYRQGGTATLQFNVNRQQVTANVGIAYDTSRSFATFRSMYVEDGNSDVDRVRSSVGVYAFLTGDIETWQPAWSALPGPWWFFYRAISSTHNTSAPDIRIAIDDVDAALAANSDTARVTVCVKHCIYLPFFIYTNSSNR